MRRGMLVRVAILWGLATTCQAQTPLNACDLVAPFGSVTASDVQAVINMTLRIIPCTANINGSNVCDSVTVQRVINAVLTGTCRVNSTNHSATLSWSASTTPGVVGGNIYRSTSSGGPYVKINTSLVIGTAYADRTVSAGVTYYYVVTAVDSGNNESVYSNEAAAVIPFP